MLDRVVVGVDGRQGGHDAIALASQLAAPSGRLLLANVYGGSGGAEEAEDLLARERDRAGAALAQVSKQWSIEVETIVHRDGNPAKALHDVAERERAGLLVVGSSHRGAIGRVLLGDHTLTALNGAPCAVAIAPRSYAAAAHPWTAFAVGYDETPESELALEAARALSERHGQATIRLVSVVTLQSVSPTDHEADWTDATTQAITEARARVEAIDGVQAEAVYGDPAEELAKIAVDVDLLIVGSRGHGAMGRLMNGSISNYLARRCPRPLLVLPRRTTEPAPPAPDAPSRDLPAPAAPES